jgi:hypothetical protein
MTTSSFPQNTYMLYRNKLSFFEKVELQLSPPPHPLFKVSPSEVKKLPCKGSYIPWGDNEVVPNVLYYLGASEL